jgi:hypothetical protein
MRTSLNVAGATVLLAALVGWAGPARPRAQAPPFMAVEDVQPGMTGIGRTVFAGDTIEEFQVHVLGVLRNVVGPKRDLILARLEGGPLATAGVIQGMSGSPVYIDGKLVGAVSYALGSFPKEPLAGITPIAEMIEAVRLATPVRAGGLDLPWPATPASGYAALQRLTDRVRRPLGRPPGDLRVVGPASLEDLAPVLRPIGVAMVVSGFDPSINRELQTAFGQSGVGQAPSPGSRPAAAPAALRPGGAVGMSLVRGDLEMGATGTVTYVDGNRVYAFGHPFLNLGPTSYAMTQARVYTILPSLDISMKIATMGPVIGTMTQDRSTAVGGMLGAGPRELEVNLTLSSDGSPDRRLKFYVIHDQLLTPLFSLVSILNTLTAYERQTGAMTVQASGTVSFGGGDQVEIDDVFSGDTAAMAAAAGITAPIGLAASNEFRPALAEKLDVRLRVAEEQEAATIERAWLDTTRPQPGATHTLTVQLRHYRGATETVSVPVEMPAQAAGPLTLLVSDAATLSALEQRDLKPAKPASWSALLAQMNTARRNNRLYVRLIATSPGAVIGGDTLPALPASIRTVLDEDKTVASAPVTKTVVGAWERRVTRALRGSRELTITLRPATGSNPANR